MISFPCSKARDVPVKFHITCIIQLFFKPLSISWSNFYQLHVLMISLRTQDILMFGEMNSKLASENSSGNESRAEGEFFFFFYQKMIKWVFKTIAIVIESLYLGIRMRVVQIHFQSLQLHTSLSTQFTFFIRYLNMLFHCTWRWNFSFKEIMRGQ